LIFFLYHINDIFKVESYPTNRAYRTTDSKSILDQFLTMAGPASSYQITLENAQDRYNQFKERPQGLPMITSVVSGKSTIKF
jgi:hypothetical protein